MAYLSSMIKKFIPSFVAVIPLLYCGTNDAAGITALPHDHAWSGFYVGVNTGYWGSQNNKISTTGSTTYINPAFYSGASSIANALAQMATNNASVDADGFIAGAQGGYNYVTSKQILVGADINLDALINSDNQLTSQRNINLAGFDESYAGTFSAKQTINYLGSLRARFGYLFFPTVLVYGTGGFAFADAALQTSWYAQESLGSTVFPAIITNKTSNQILTGWTAGGGLEWLFKPNMSILLEYAYYSFNSVNVSTVLAQSNASVSPAVPWGSATANTAFSPSVWTVRIGINYHF